MQADVEFLGAGVEHLRSSTHHLVVWVDAQSVGIQHQGMLKFRLIGEFNLGMTIVKKNLL